MTRLIFILFCFLKSPSLITGNKENITNAITNWMILLGCVNMWEAKSTDCDWYLCRLILFYSYKNSMHTLFFPLCSPNQLIYNFQTYSVEFIVTLKRKWKLIIKLTNRDKKYKSEFGKYSRKNCSNNWKISLSQWFNTCKYRCCWFVTDLNFFRI